MAGLSKIGEQERIQIRQLRKDERLKYKELAFRFGVSLPHISSIISGRTGARDMEPPQKMEIKPHALPWCTKARLMAGR